MGNKQAKQAERTQHKEQPTVVPLANPMQHAKEDSPLADSASNHALKEPDLVLMDPHETSLSRSSVSARDHQSKCNESHSMLVQVNEFLEQEQCRRIIDHWFCHIFQHHLDTNLSNMIYTYYCDLDEILMCYSHASASGDDPDDFTMPADHTEHSMTYIVSLSGKVYKATDITEDIHDLDALQAQYVNEQHSMQSLQLSHAQRSELLSILILLQINLRYHRYESGGMGWFRDEDQCIVHTGKHLAERHGLSLKVYDRKDLSSLDVKPLLRFLKRDTFAVMGNFGWLQLFKDFAESNKSWHRSSVTIDEESNTMELAEEWLYS